MRTVLQAAEQAVREARIAFQAAEERAEKTRADSIAAEKARVRAQRELEKAEADYRKVKDGLQ